MSLSSFVAKIYIYIYFFFSVQKALEHGYKMVRVRVQGLGPGRMVSTDNIVLIFCFVCWCVCVS
jgi:hypothetical protein